jgi:hypothetical protein
MKMNNGIKKVFAFLPAVFPVFLFFSISAYAGQNNYTGHDSVSVSSAVSIAESQAVRFGNFAVTSPGGNDAYITLDIDGTRTAHNGASTTITLLNGGVSDLGSQGPGYYRVQGAGSGTQLNIGFVDHTGAAITSGNPVILTGPVGSDEFHVDTMTFNSDGTNAGGLYIAADGSGNATVRIGATLHTKAGATTYAPGTYRGTFEILVSY